MTSGIDWTEATTLGAIVDLDAGVSLDAHQIRANVAARSRHMKEMGVVAGDLVAISSETSSAVLIDVLAAWRLGACAAVLDPTLSEPETQNVVRFLKPRLSLSRQREIVGANARRMEGDGFDSPALVLLTSGTTGAPKAVVHSHRVLMARVELNRAAIGDECLHRALLTLPLHFGHGLIGNALTPLLAGGTLFLHPRGPKLAASLGAIVDDNGVTFMSSVPSFWQLALRTSVRPQPGTLKRIHIGSAPLSPALWENVAEWSGGATVVNCYGITETANWIGGEALDASVSPGAVGRPWGGSYGVRDQAGHVTASGEGEIVVRSPSLMLGYLDRPDLTQAVLSGGWYATGDTGMVDAAGRLTLSGRIKDEINRAGQKIQPADIDIVIQAHPAVDESCTFAMPDPVSGEAVAAAVVVRKDASVDRAALATWCASRLRPTAVPERWFFVEAIPRTARGKISRAAVREALMPVRADA